jgi:hypothetical protein
VHTPVLIEHGVYPAVAADGAQKVHYCHVAVPGNVVLCADIYHTVRSEQDAVVGIDQRALEEELDRFDECDGVARGCFRISQLALCGASRGIANETSSAPNLVVMRKEEMLEWG